MYFRAFKARVCFKKTSTGHIAKSAAEEREKKQSTLGPARSFVFRNYFVEDQICCAISPRIVSGFRRRASFFDAKDTRSESLIKKGKEGRRGG